jgi:hypothetical protein
MQTAVKHNLQLYEPENIENLEIRASSCRSLTHRP